jgi:hypothetical protein
MFSVLRIVFIVGLIFYHSPVRQAGSEAEMLDKLLTRDSEPALASAGTPSNLDALWDALPESAKQSIVDRIVASVLGPEPNRKEAALQRTPTDTLEPEDFQPSWQGAGKSQPQS